MGQSGVSVLKIIFLILLHLSLLNASSVAVERDIYHAVFHALFPDAQSIYIWTDDPKKADIFKSLSHIEIVTNPKHANLAVVYKTEDLPPNLIKFVGDYHLLKHYKNAIGGFYWQKGRPNLIFLKSSLQEYRLKLPPKFQKYVEDRL